jgi:K+-transporting ATPase ATPase B chain
MNPQRPSAKPGLHDLPGRTSLLVFAGVTEIPTGVVLLILAFAGTNVAARPALLALALVVWLWVLVGGVALSLRTRRGRGVAQPPDAQKAVRAYRVRGGEAGHRLRQAAGQDYLLIRTTGVAAVFHGSGDSAPLRVEETVSSELRPGELVLVEAGQVVPCDGEIVEGAATIDEAAVTGVSWPVFHEAGGPHAGVLGGTLVVSGRAIIRVTG